MALDRKDIRAWFDADLHEAIRALADEEGLELQKFVEQVTERYVMAEIHRYRLRRARFESLVLIRDDPEKPGKGH